MWKYADASAVCTGMVKKFSISKFPAEQKFWFSALINICMFSKSFLNLPERDVEGFLPQVKWLNIPDINFSAFLCWIWCRLRYFPFGKKKKKNLFATKMLSILEIGFMSRICMGLIEIYANKGERRTRRIFVEGCKRLNSSDGDYTQPCPAAEWRIEQNRSSQGGTNHPGGFVHVFTQNKRLSHCGGNTRGV